MKTVKGIVVLFVIAMLCVWAAGAGAIPQKITYQGKLTDSSGNPLTGSYSMVFKIYDVETGGSALWTETRNVSVAKGAYSLVLGENTVIPTSVFDGNERWLGIKVGGDSEMIPRMKIVSVGNAYKAYDADNLGGHPASYFTPSSEGGNYVLKTGDKMTGRLTIEGATATTVLKLDAGGGDNYVDLTTNGALRITPNGDYWLGPSWQFWPTGTAGHGMYFDAGSATGTDLFFRSAPGGSNALVIKQGTGNAIFSNYVGIGTTPPTVPLHISGSTASTLLKLDAGGGSNYVDLTTNGALRITANGNYETGPSWQFWPTGTGGQGMYFDAGSATGADLFFRTAPGGSNALVVKQGTGYVGIGTSEPSVTLEVKGIVKATAFEGNGAALTNVPATDSTKVLKTGDTMTGWLTCEGLTSTATISTTSIIATSAQLGSTEAYFSVGTLDLGETYGQYPLLLSNGTGPLGGGGHLGAIDQYFVIAGETPSLAFVDPANLGGLGSFGYDTSNNVFTFNKPLQGPLSIIGGILSCEGLSMNDVDTGTSLDRLRLNDPDAVDNNSVVNVGGEYDGSVAALGYPADTISTQIFGQARNDGTAGGAYVGIAGMANSDRNAAEIYGLFGMAYGSGAYGFGAVGGTSDQSISGLGVLDGYANSGLLVQYRAATGEAMRINLLDTGADAVGLSVHQHGTGDMAQFNDNNTLVLAVNDTGQLYFRDVDEDKIYFDGDGGSEKIEMTADGLKITSAQLTVNGNSRVTGDLSVEGQSYFIGDVTIEGTLHGGSPLKIAGGLSVEGEISGNASTSNYATLSGSATSATTASYATLTGTSSTCSGNALSATTAGTTARCVLTAADITVQNGINNDVNIGTNSYIRLIGPGAAYIISGFTGDNVGGKVIYVNGTTAFACQISNEGLASTAGNRILTNTGALVTTAALGGWTGIFVYDATSVRWRMIAYLQ